MNSKSRYRRYTIRSLFILIVAAAIPVWWASTERAKYIRELKTASELRKLEPQLEIRMHPVGGSQLFNNLADRLGISTQWNQRVIGVDITGSIYGEREIDVDEIPIDFNDADFHRILPQLRKLPHLRKLYLHFTRTSDEILDEIASLDKLDFVNLKQTGMSSPAVRSLESEMPNTKIAFFHDLLDPWE